MYGISFSYGFAFGSIIGLYGLGLIVGSTIAGYIHDFTYSHSGVFVMIATVATLIILEAGSPKLGVDGKSI